MEVSINRITKFWNKEVAQKIAGGLLAVLAFSGVASAQDKSNQQDSKEKVYV